MYLQAAEFDWPTLKRARDAHVHDLNRHYANYLAGNSVEVVAGTARFIGPRVVEVGGEHYSAHHVIIATGGHPIVPDIPGAAHGITSDGFFELGQQPHKVAIVGAGYIAAELSGLLHALHSEVRVVLRRDRLLMSFDPMLRETLMEHMRAERIEFLTGTQIVELEKDPTGRLTLLCDVGRVLRAGAAPATRASAAASPRSPRLP